MKSEIARLDSSPIWAWTFSSGFRRNWMKSFNQFRRFSLRWLFLVMTVAALISGFFSSVLVGHWRERAALDQIPKLNMRLSFGEPTTNSGSTISGYLWPSDNSGHVLVDYVGPNCLKLWAKKLGLSCCCRATSMVLNGPSYTNQILDYVTQLKSLDSSNYSIQALLAKTFANCDESFLAAM